MGREYQIGTTLRYGDPCIICAYNLLALYFVKVDFNLKSGTRLEELAIHQVYLRQGERRETTSLILKIPPIQCTSEPNKSHLLHEQKIGLAPMVARGYCQVKMANFDTILTNAKGHKLHTFSHFWQYLLVFCLILLFS